MQTKVDATAKAHRACLETIIEALIALLDEIDGDADAEVTPDDEGEYDPAESGIGDLSGLREQIGGAI